MINRMNRVGSRVEEDTSILASAVRYDADQIRSDEEKAQARSNMGAISAAQLADTKADLEEQIENISGISDPEAVSQMVTQVAQHEEDISDLKSSLDEINDNINAVTPIVNWRNGSVNNPSNEQGISFADIVSSDYSTSVTILIDTPLSTGHKYRFQLTTYTVDSGKPEANSANRVTIEKTILTEENFVTYDLLDGSMGFACAVYEKDESDNYVPLRITTFDTSAIHVIKTHDSSRLLQQNNYAINSSFLKTPISITQVGWVNGLQSFCRYNDKYYSYGGGVLYEQNLDFSRVGQTSLNIGHGNSLQLGSNGIAYASGWDDQNVYAVDLANKTLINTITLPTTGYTTCAVDDINGIIYIFQRDTSPSTEEYYNFIVYDYINDTVKSTRKIVKAFGAIQSCDFINGLIIVANGLGTNRLPNGLRIYNTSGDILSEFVIGEMSEIEPEGIFVDRSNYEILISYATGNLYRVEERYI